MPPSDKSSAAARGMTLVEMVIVVCVLGMGLFALVGWMGGVRQDARRDLAVRLLSELDKALARYHRSEGRYPSSPGPHSATWATVTLLDHDRTRPILEALPASIWRGPGRRTLVDPWGTALRYLSEESGSPFVKANNGMPVFVSAGPDKDFGDQDPAGLGDNLRSDDPGPDGFRLHHVLRDSLAPEESRDGEEDHR